MLNRSYIQGHVGHPHYFTDAQVSALKKTITLSPKEKKLVFIMRNLADPTKLKIYKLLHCVTEISVTDVTQILGMTQPAVSHALADLRNIGLVESHRCGQLICYSLRDGNNETASLFVKDFSIRKK